MAKKTTNEGDDSGARTFPGGSGGFAWEKQNETLIAQLHENLGETVHLFRELIPTGARVDIYLLAPTRELPFHKLVTLGMSQVEMPAPDDFAEYSRAELIMGLPDGWPITPQDLAGEEHGWPLRALREIARFPGAQAQKPRWVAAGHRLSFQATMAERFTGALLLPPLLLLEESQVIFNQELEPVFLLGVVPLYAEEMAQEDAQALLEALDELEVTEILDPQRPNACETN